MVTVEADEIVEAIRQAVEVERVRKMAETKTGMKYGEISSDNKLTGEKQPERAEQKIAQTFNTNRTYVNEAANCPYLSKWDHAHQN